MQGVASWPSIKPEVTAQTESRNPVGSAKGFGSFVFSPRVLDACWWEPAKLLPANRKLLAFHGKDLVWA